MNNSEYNKKQGLLKPGDIIRPIISTDVVVDLVKELYGLEVLCVKEFKSYDDKNYYIKVAEENDNPYMQESWPHGYVVKVLNSMDSQDENLVHGQNRIMHFLREKGFYVPVPVKNKFGTYFRKHTFAPTVSTVDLDHCSGQKEHIVRLLTFMPGKNLCEIDCTPDVFYQCGEYIGKMDDCLKGFHDDALRDRNCIWMMGSTPEVRKFVGAVKNDADLKLVLEVLDCWDNFVTPQLKDLEKGFIHGDFNEQNILVSEDEAGCPLVTGIIDFGDVSVSCYIFELAITVTYMMLESKTSPPEEAGGHVLAGYLKYRSLSETEWDILKECVCARLVTSLVMGAYSYASDPENEYVLTSAVHGWKLLRSFWNLPKEEILSKWRSVVDSSLLPK